MIDLFRMNAAPGIQSGTPGMWEGPGVVLEYAQPPGILIDKSYDEVQEMAKGAGTDWAGLGLLGAAMLAGKGRGGQEPPAPSSWRPSSGPQTQYAPIYTQQVRAITPMEAYLRRGPNALGVGPGLLF